MFVVKAREVDVPPAGSLDRAFRAWVARLDAPLVVAGPWERILFDGCERAARACVVGRDEQATNWCVTSIPVPRVAGAELLVMMGVGARSAGSPRCQLSMAHPHIAPVVASFRFE
jgi:hypothetical protein